MYESAFGLKEKPFSLLPDPSFTFLGQRHSAALAMLQYGLLSESVIAVITGEIGSGKTTLIRHVINEQRDDVTIGLITNTHRSFGELLRWVLMAFGLDHQNKDKVDAYQCFVDFVVDQYSKGRRTVLIIDEAQNMDAETLEELRMLSNVNADKHMVLQLVLVGQPELRDRLKAPGLEQFVQRISVNYHLDSMTPPETRAYIRHRLTVAGGDPDLFCVDAADAIHVASRGVPRLVNVLCDMALVYAYAASTTHVDAAIVGEVVRDRGKTGLFSNNAVEAGIGEAAGRGGAILPGVDEVPEGQGPPQRPGNGLDNADVTFIDDAWLAQHLGMTTSTIRSQRSKRLHGHDHWLTLDPVFFGSRPRYRLADALQWLKTKSGASRT